MKHKGRLEEKMEKFEKLSEEMKDPDLSLEERVSKYEEVVESGIEVRKILDEIEARVTTAKNKYDESTNKNIKTDAELD